MRGTARNENHGTGSPAAVSMRSIADWSGFWYTADFSQYTPSWFRKAPWEDPADYIARSPITHVGNVKTPTMFIDGDDDLRDKLFEAFDFDVTLQTCLDRFFLPAGHLDDVPTLLALNNRFGNRNRLPLVIRLLEPYRLTLIGLYCTLSGGP